MKKGIRALFCCLLAMLTVCSASVAFAQEDVTLTETERAYVLPPVVRAESLGGSRYQIHITNLHWPSTVQVPTWSDANGQDDIVWYNASNRGGGEWVTVLDSAPHGGGTMHSHVYADGMAVGSTDFVAPVAPDPVVTCIPAGGTRYKVSATNLSWASKVQMPTWSEERGQDDAVWHNAVYEGNGVWSTYVDSTPHGGGRMYTSVYANGKPVGTVSYLTSETRKIDVSVEPLGDARFRITAKNIPWASKVRMRTWSDRNSTAVDYVAGMNGDGSWTAIINTNRHGGGRIYTDVYADDKPIGSVSYVGPDVPDVTFTAEPLGNNRFRVSAHNLYWPTRVTIPTWSEDKGQDDIAWYQTHYNGFGTWSAVIDASAHGGGYMISHFYADNKPVGSVTYVADYKDRPTVKAEGIGGSKFKVVIQNLNHAKTVQVAAWNETVGTSKTLWYPASYDGNGVWSAAIDAADLGPGRIVSNVYADGENVGQTQVIFQLSA